jgi:hypothetical protein
MLAEILAPIQQRLEELEQRLGRIESLSAAPDPRQSEEEERLTAQLAEVRAERDDYAATVDEFIRDHKLWQERALTPEKRDRILNALDVGKQSLTYKRVKAALDQMMS